MSKVMQFAGRYNGQVFHLILKPPTMMRNGMAIFMVAQLVGAMITYLVVAGSNPAVDIFASFLPTFFHMYCYNS